MNDFLTKIMNSFEPPGKMLFCKLRLSVWLGNPKFLKKTKNWKKHFQQICKTLNGGYHKNANVLVSSTHGSEGKYIFN